MDEVNRQDVENWLDQIEGYEAPAPEINWELCSKCRFYEFKSFGAGPVGGGVNHCNKYNRDAIDVMEYQCLSQGFRKQWTRNSNKS